jgi:hypothetical protein
MTKEEIIYENNTARVIDCRFAVDCGVGSGIELCPDNVCEQHAGDQHQQ